MLQLNNLDKLTKKRKRVGRGGSRGGTSGKGHKGQKARSGGKVPAYFEGGQMSITRRLPKRGFKNYDFKTEYALITLDQLNRLFANETTVTKEMVIEAGVSKKGQKVKLLATGMLDKKLILEIDACSKSAKEAVERVGGEVKLLQE
ncbi:MAG: 50S ribosomal protein L15 [Epsilonproteobacteria bacterium]|nr:50S ribosomal protein L15 [Campylobacterota bacterium]|tara:strand:+ start:734 stop:1171 length:438 start_codon:yes stop_codon:yes gene_type:complete